MANADSPRVHPTAVISPEAELADDIEIGPYAIVEGRVKIGSGCVLRPHAMVIGPLTMGSGNTVFSGAILGERPQHFKYNNEPTGVEIGDNNTFREYATVNRGTTHSWATRIGSNNYFMCGCHVAHDCQIGNNCILVNAALLAGHCILEDNVYLSGNTTIHQFVRIGRLALLSGNSATSKDIPPFIIQQGMDSVGGVNVVGMRRAGLSNMQIAAIRKAFQTIFRGGLLLTRALEEVEREMGHIDVVQELTSFIRKSHRGINTMRDRGRSEAA